MIAVLGASGRIGRHVAAGLAERSVEARALVRRPSAAAAPLPASSVDLADRASIRAALDGATRLFLLTPNHPDQDLYEATVVEAAVGAGVEHVVKVSGGAPSLGPNGVSATATAHWHSEQRVERSGLGFTFLRPSFLQQNLLTQVAPIVAKGGVLAAPFARAPIAMVDARDVAAAAVAALLDPDPVGTAWHLTGPRGVTFADLAAHLGVRYLPIPPRVAWRALRRQCVSAVEAEHAFRMATYFSSGADGAPTDHVARLTGRPPRAVEALLDESHQAFAPATALARLVSRRDPTGKD